MHDEWPTRGRRYLSEGVSTSQGQGRFVLAVPGEVQGHRRPGGDARFEEKQERCGCGNGDVGLGDASVAKAAECLAKACCGSAGHGRVDRIDCVRRR